MEIAAVTGTADVRCNGTGSNTASTASFEARDEAGNTALAAKFKATSLGVPAGIYRVVYADGGYQNFEKSRFYTGATPIEPSLVKGNGQVQPKNCGATS